MYFTTRLPLQVRPHAVREVPGAPLLRAAGEHGRPVQQGPAGLAGAAARRRPRPQHRHDRLRGARRVGGASGRRQEERLQRPAAVAPRQVLSVGSAS